MTTATLEIREVQIREVNSEKREIVGLAVPYGEVINVGGFKEKFERGAFDGSTDVKLFYGHDHRNGGTPIGRVVEAKETDEGYVVRSHISETPKGDEVYRLASDGVLNSFSIGFEPVENRIEDDVVVRVKAKLQEVSVVAFPAYATAQITEVRSEVEHNKEEEDMTEVMTTEVADLRETVTELERRLAVFLEGGDGNEATPQFRSAGELLKALAANEDAARTELRDFGSTVEADVTRPGWVQRPLKFKEEKRKMVNLFDRAPLPPTGNTVEYPQVSSTSGTVSKQVTEGAALEYMEVALDTGTATVGTYGGFSSLSRQAIERSDLAYLDAVLRYQAIQYGKATNLVVRNALTAMTGTGTATLTAGTAVGWIGLVIDAIGSIEDNSLGLDAEFIVVGRDVFKNIMSIVDANERPVFALNGDGQNTIGSGNLVKSTFNIAGVSGVVDPGLAANSCYVASAGAMTVLESPGAPFRLQDESVINLTKDFSLYGYLAVTENDPQGVVKCDVDLVA